MTPTIPDVVQKTHEILKSVRKNVVLLMQNLYFLRENYEDKEMGTSFGSYAEEEFGLSQSYVSKLCSVAEHFLVKGGVAPERLASLDYEKLNMVRMLPVSVEEQLSRAETLTRSEIRQDQQEAEPHAYQPLEYCKICHGSKENHN